MIEVSTEQLSTDNSTVLPTLETIDSTKNSTLTTTLQNGTLYLLLKTFSFGEETVSCFDLSISNETLP